MGLRRKGLLFVVALIYYISVRLIGWIYYNKK